MSESGEDVPKAGGAEQGIAVTPREIKGLLEAASNERNLDFTFQIPALYLGRRDQEFMFDLPRGVSPSAIFELKVPDFREETKLREQGKVSPPDVILRVSPDEGLVPEMKELMKRRAIEHNAAKIQEYLEKGGDKSLLPQTELLPPESTS